MTTPSAVEFDIARRSPWPAIYTACTLRNPFSTDGGDEKASCRPTSEALAAYGKAASRDDLDVVPVWAGEAIDLITEITSAREIVGALAAGARNRTDAARGGLTSVTADRSRTGRWQLPGRSSFLRVLGAEGPMNRTDVNPWEWSKAFRLLPGGRSHRGAAPPHLLRTDGNRGRRLAARHFDMGEQVKKAFENLGVVLHAAGLASSDVVRVNYYTTDVDELIAVLGPLASEFFGETLPASTLLGVTRLAFPQLKIEDMATTAARWRARRLDSGGVQHFIGRRSSRARASSACRRRAGL